MGISTLRRDKNRPLKNIFRFFGADHVLTAMTKVVEERISKTNSGSGLHCSQKKHLPPLNQSYENISPEKFIKFFGAEHLSPAMQRMKQEHQPHTTYAFPINQHKIE
jgi:hypothetical protein